jgi:hypothetical protein
MIIQIEVQARVIPGGSKNERGASIKVFVATKTLSSE